MVAAMIRRPVQGRPRCERENSKRSQEPPENRKSQSPAHGRTVASHVTLEEQPKAGTNEHSHAKLKSHGRHPRVRFAERCDQREEITSSFSSTRKQSTENA